MKKLADAAFALACVVVVAVVVRNQFVRVDNAPRADEGLIQAGTSFPGIPAERGQTTLVIYLSASCRFCQESMPFYRALSTRVQQAAATKLAFPVRGDLAAFKSYLSTNDLDPESAANLPVIPGVVGTPTVVAVSSGIIAGSWSGRLSAEQEEKVLSLVR